MMSLAQASPKRKTWRAGWSAAMNKTNFAWSVQMDANGKLLCVNACKTCGNSLRAQPGAVGKCGCGRDFTAPLTTDGLAIVQTKGFKKRYADNEEKIWREWARRRMQELSEAL